MPSSQDRAILAAQNNAAWCDAVCRAHGRPGRFGEHLWLNLNETPRFYSNAITLTRLPGRDTQLAGIRQLLSADLGRDKGGWSVKDSFCTLDLGPLGCQVLFEAAWLWRAPALPPLEVAQPGVRWSRIRAASELADWEHAWAGRQFIEPSPASPIFRAGLLDDADIVILAAYEGERIAAGAILNRSGEVVGLSNVFVPPERHADFWAACVGAGVEVFPELPLVGYERGAALATARSLGFEELGPLRVWVHEPAN